MAERAMTTPLASTERWTDAADPLRRIGRAIEHVPVIGSTNDRARELLASGDADGTAVVADEQVAGRGRQGRTWSSPPGLNLMVSVGLRPALAAGDAWRLSAVAALAVVAAARHHAPLAVAWPNDVVAEDGRKVAGILVETTLAGERLRDAVVGIGINVNWRRTAMPAELAARATSLADLAGGRVDRVALLRSLLDALDVEVGALERGASPLGRYRAACATLGADVRVDAPGATISGRAVAIDDAGALVIEPAMGSAPVTVTSGDVIRLHREVPA
jgi:BirA family transcriptional regulator, biotin operon repressor / biotin---[acetyl-CoA-carboxylase] ligase